MSEIKAITQQARCNSQRWFPFVHKDDEAVVPLWVHYTLGLAGEAGEVANLVKKGLRKGAPPEGIDLELADVFIYLLLLADEVGVDLVNAYERKRDINEGRWGGGLSDIVARARP